MMVKVDDRVLKAMYRYVRMSWQRFAFYRANAVVGLVVHLLWTVVVIVFVQSIYSHVRAVGGWSYGEMLTLLGTSDVVTELNKGVFGRGVGELVGGIVNGRLDMLLCRPIGLYEHLAIRGVEVQRLVRIGIPLTIVGYGLAEVGTRPILVIGYCVLVMLSVEMLRCLYMCVAASGFWMGKSGGALMMLDQLVSWSQWPLDIYPRYMLAVVFVVPALVSVTIPVRVVIGKGDWASVGVYLLVLVAVELASRFALKRGLTRYAGG